MSGGGGDGSSSDEVNVTKLSSMIKLAPRLLSLNRDFLLFLFLKLTMAPAQQQSTAKVVLMAVISSREIARHRERQAQRRKVVVVVMVV